MRFRTDIGAFGALVLSTCLAAGAFLGSAAADEPSEADPPAAVLRPEAAARPASTLIVYGACDNDGEPHFLGKVNDMVAAARGFADGEKIVVFVDRAEGHADEEGPLDEAFTGARVYEIDNAGIRRVGRELFADRDGEPATGDPEVLSRFVSFARARGEAPYSLVIYGHGDGTRFGYDESSETADGKWMTIPELVNALRGPGGDSGPDEDGSAGGGRFAVLGFDVCNMGLVANGAALAPVAELMVASAPLSGPWPYAAILGRVDDTPRFARPFGRVVLDELDAMFPERDDRDRTWQAMQSWALVDCDAAARAQQALDELLAGETGRACARSPFEGIDYRPLLPGYDASRYPFDDLYDRARAIADDERLPAVSRERANRVAAAADEAVIGSFGGAFYDGFEPGKHGLGAPFPEAAPRDR